MITDLRALNDCTDTPRHKAESWKTVKEALQSPDLTWGITLDLKSWFHHLGIHKKTQRWMRFQLSPTEGYQIQAMPFGWAASPWWAQKMAKPIQAWMNQNNIPHCWWVDDILILGDLLSSLGIRVNKDKSMTAPAQVVQYVGHVINFQDNKLHPVPSKLPLTLRVLKEAGRGLKILPRHLAKVGGHLLDCVKSNVSLHGLPQQLMKEAGRAVYRNSQLLGTWDEHKVWGTPVQKSQALKTLLLDCQKAIQNPTPRPFRPQKDSVYTLQTDASDRGWGASLKFARRLKSGPRKKKGSTSPTERPWLRLLAAGGSCRR